jgi:PhnB protein
MPTPVPDRYHTLTPGLFLEDGLAAIDFYERALGAEVVWKLVVGDKVLLADLRIGQSIFQLSDVLPGIGVAAPDTTRGDSAAILIWTEDVDGWHARAVEAGAEVVNSPETRFHGYHSGAIRDPFGHRWAFVKQVEEVSDEELVKRAMEVFAGSAPPSDPPTS